ncbi:hypothetical protein BUALT_Bualt06G0095200 [Buddleja alternifolia]|uniref:Uncharacterized protein n=1 Tax=Buddleja alternifolia TaxID=168488 RepID=A0AAV6XKP1_9LAMI|nr:hypothetical protein BUALT_Bualt06G0095200 [Buddleja alternifolia]
MAVDQIETALRKICDLHDKLSGAIIRSVSRAHFLNSVNNPTGKCEEFYLRRKKKSDDDNPKQKSDTGAEFVKEFQAYGDDSVSAVVEARSLYAIRTALENLEDQLEFFRIVQIQQRAERDAAIVRLGQTRIIIAMRLSEHQGKNYKLIQEAQALVSDIRETSRFVAPECPFSESFIPQKRKGPNAIINFFVSCFTFLSKSLKLDHKTGILGNAALLALSMLAFMHLNQGHCDWRYTLHLSRFPCA